MFSIGYVCTNELIRACVSILVCTVISLALSLEFFAHVPYSSLKQRPGKVGGQLASAAISNKLKMLG